MTWTEASSGVYSTELGGVEKIHRFFSRIFKPTGHKHWAFTAPALRQEFPAPVIVPDGLTRETYVVPNASPVEKWPNETLVVDFIDPDAILASYPARDHPSMHFFPEISQIGEHYKNAIDTGGIPYIGDATTPSGASGNLVEPDRSLGVIEKLLSKEHEGSAVKMTDFHFSVSMLTRQMLLYVWTSNGKMSFSINYNEAYHVQRRRKRFWNILGRS
ncbi:hypothetical protein GGR53DRAFT_471047 [Hypoxylon sp. FL1150]|nr:hypothetical protein GGR53DRAFT_471047 [Hypoxylon sp. FL1150]